MVVTVVAGARVRVDEVGIALEGALFETMQAGNRGRNRPRGLAARAVAPGRGRRLHPGSLGSGQERHAGAPAGAGAIRRRSCATPRPSSTRRRARSSCASSTTAGRCLPRQHADRGARSLRRGGGVQPAELASGHAVHRTARHLAASAAEVRAVPRSALDRAAGRPDQAASATVLVTLRGSDAPAGHGRRRLQLRHRRPRDLQTTSTTPIPGAGTWSRPAGSEIGKQLNSWTGRIIQPPLPTTTATCVGQHSSSSARAVNCTSAALRWAQPGHRAVGPAVCFVAVQSAAVEAAAPETSAQAVTLTATAGVTLSTPTRCSAHPRHVVLAFETGAGCTTDLGLDRWLRARRGHAQRLRRFGDGCESSGAAAGRRVFAASAAGVPDTLLFRAAARTRCAAAASGPRPDVQLSA